MNKKFDERIFISHFKKTHKYGARKWAKLDKYFTNGGKRAKKREPCQGKWPPKAFDLRNSPCGGRATARWMLLLQLFLHLARDRGAIRRTRFGCAKCALMHTSEADYRPHNRTRSYCRASTPGPFFYSHSPSRLLRPPPLAQPGNTERFIYNPPRHFGLGFVLKLFSPILPGAIVAAARNTRSALNQ